MKKYISTLLFAIVLLSCTDKFLEEETYGLIRPTNYFTTLSDLEKCVNALYSSCNLMYNESSCLVACMAGDDVTTQAGGNKAGYLQFDLFNAQDNNDRLPTSWNNGYGAIKQANVIINSIDQFVEPADQPELLQDQKDRALGQAYFVRALAYFNLVRIYGQVPLVTEVTIDYEVTKASFEDIYNLIVTDLTSAEALVPMDYSTASNVSDLETNTAHARADKGAVKALLASVYLNMAGYPLKDVSKYALAAQKAKEVIDNEDTYGYELLVNYGDLWKWENGWKNIGNAEDVFACFFNHTAGNWSDGGTWANGNMNAPSAFFPENFGGWSDAFAELNFFNEFPEGPRKDATFITVGQKTPTSPVITWQEFAYAHPYYNKYTDLPGYDPTNMGAWIDWWSSRTVQVIRYAEVLLVYAEAKAMSDGADNLAYECLNRVRNRAGLDDAPEGLNGTDFRDKVVEERKWEFAGMEPCARWFDMVRTETVETATAKRDASEIPIVNTPTKDRYFAPIPQADRIINSNL
ncbi:MAG: RagB/SusD family nutrient uptake outer membrane protein [Mangrovibacterium sp.]